MTRGERHAGAHPRPGSVTLAVGLRQSWRGLTSMRTALVLLFALALAAVPGSVLPQRPLNPFAVDRFLGEHSIAGPIYDRLGFFDTFAAPWFVGLYLLICVSLVGCLTPRIRLHARALAARPPRPPRSFARLPRTASVTTTLPPAEVAAAVRRRLRARRWRTETRVHDDGATSVSAEKGYARETGNLVFHLAILGVIAGVAVGALLGYEGRAIVVEGTGFTNTAVAYDELDPSRLGGAADLAPFSLVLDDFDADYTDGGQPTDFRADVRYAEGFDEPRRRTTLRVNHPLSVAGSRVYLLAHGYAPHIVVRDKDGRVVYDEVTPFLPQDGSFLSTGVIKVPDVSPGLPQIGVRAAFLPTVDLTRDGRLFSGFPDARAPAVSFEAFAGDLGLDAGLPQNVYELDTRGMVRTGGGFLLPGETSGPLAGGATMTFVGFREWANVQVARDPGQRIVLVSAVLALAGLMTSLRVRRRRIWARVIAGPGGTLVEVGGLPRRNVEAFASEFDRLVAELREHLPPAPREPAAPQPTADAVPVSDVRDSREAP
ncbi:MAG TPA: cytochrome c biogenesis protein ResB [Mycobacteriales bacterium]|nr:cytochrome c biogenesis protein ResB [Mycobacteriales bacterium]